MTATSYATCSSACAAAFQWRHALLIYRAWRGRPTAALLTAAMGAFRRWQEALDALETATVRRMQMDAIMYNVLLHVCEKGHQWQKASKSPSKSGRRR